MYSSKKLIEASIPNCQRDSIKLVALKYHERSHKIQVRKLFCKLLIKDYELSNSHICGKHDVDVICQSDNDNRLIKID